MIADTTPLDLTADVTVSGVLVGAFFVLAVIVFLIAWGAALQERRLERAERRAWHAPPSHVRLLREEDR